MIKAIIDGICGMLHDTFTKTEDALIYTERIPQGASKEHFTIRCISPRSTQVIGNRYFRNNLFRIQYFPTESEKEPEAACNNVLEALYTAAEIITITEVLPDESIKTSPLRGTDMRGEVIDGVLNFFVNYNCFIFKTVIADSEMDDVEYTPGVKG
jgi:hypothetical protein